ncbi:MAG: TonB-dependent receptor [Halieaceae bacterium]|nr:TonB-dependent receptor [Halieaceae bacterium]
MSSNRVTTLILSCAAGAVLMTTPVNDALAQDSATALEEVIVTARKREESLQDAPVVISALTLKTMSDFSIESVEDIADFTPGLVADSQGNASGGVLFLRGVGSGSASPSIDQAVSLVIDDMQVGHLQIQNSAMIDMEAVQVYKGPQALFFGKNSPGGVISIRTADPGEEFEGQLKTGYDLEADEWFVQGVVSGPFSDTAAGRLVVRYTETDGYFDVESGSFPSALGDSAIEGESVFARGSLVLTPTDDLNIRAKLTYSDTDDVADGRVQIQVIHCPLGAPQNSEPFNCKANRDIQSTYIPQGAIDVFAEQGISMDPSGVGENEQVLATVAIDYDINDELRLSSITGYYELTNLANSTVNFAVAEPIASSEQDLEFEQFSQELRLASDFSGPVNFLAGVYYEKKEHDSIITVPLNFGQFGGLGFDLWVLGGVTDYAQDAEAMSAFFDVAWNITENLELSGGVRYSWEEKEFDGAGGYVGQDKQDWDDVSPQLTLSYSPNDNWMLFASYREGFKSGGFDGAFQFTPRDLVSYEPEYVEGFEVGAKGRLLDETLQLNAAIFTYDYEDLQLGRWDPETISLSVVNAAVAEITGAEVDFIWVTPVDGLQARGAITYLDAEFEEYLAPCYTGQTIAAGCNENFSGGAFQSQDLSGEPLNLAAEYVVSLGLSHEQELGSVVLGLSLDAIYTDDYETSSNRTLETTQDSFTKVDVAVRLSSVDDAWSVTLIGRNLTDEFPITGGGASPFTGANGGTVDAFPADTIGYVRPGRTYAVEFEYNF